MISKNNVTLGHSYIQLLKVQVPAKLMPHYQICEDYDTLLSHPACALWITSHVLHNDFLMDVTWAPWFESLWLEPRCSAYGAYGVCGQTLTISVLQVVRRVEKPTQDAQDICEVVVGHSICLLTRTRC